MFDFLVKKLEKYNKSREFFVKDAKYVEVPIKNASAYLANHGII